MKSKSSRVTVDILSCKLKKMHKTIHFPVNEFYITFIIGFNSDVIFNSTLFLLRYNFYEINCLTDKK